MNESTTIRETIQQTKPFRSRSTEAVIGIYLVGDRLRRHFQGVVGPEDITSQQYNVLRILRGAGSQGLPTLSIPERMVEQTPGITRLLDRLEAKGLVERTRCDEDRRLVRAAITADGLAMLDRLDGPLEAADRAALQMLSDADMDELIRLLELVLSGN